MRLLKPSGILKCEEKVLWPFTTYVVPDDLVDGGGVSCLDRIKPYAAGKGEGGKIAVYATGTLENLLLATGIIRYLVEHELYTDVDVYCPMPHETLFKGIGSRQIAYPPSLEAWEAYDCHLPLDELLIGKRELLADDGQSGNYYDRIYGWMGVNPGPMYKSPFLVALTEDEKELGEIGVWPMVGPYFVYNICYEETEQIYPLQQATAAIEALLEKLPDHRAVIIGKNDQMTFALDHPRVVNLFNKTKAFRSLYPLVEKADFSVSVDMVVSCLAAGLSCPIVSLWGASDPAWLIKYVKNSKPIYPAEVCPHSPCLLREDLPDTKCNDATIKADETTQCCHVLQAITKEMILEKVTLILKNKP